MLAIAARAPKIDWNSLLARSAEQYGSFPCGFHDGEVLRRTIQSGQAVNGLVISIGVITARNSDRCIPDRVLSFIKSLPGPGEFACQWNRDEFILICPTDLGAAAQQRLGEICRQLWDFQLQSPGDLATLFSWGGVEVANESVGEAIAMATMRMQETWRARKALMTGKRGEEIRIVLTSPAECLS